MNGREFLTKWGFNIEHEKLTKVEEQLEGIKHRLEFLAAAEVVKAVYELTERFAHFAEELHVAATSAGLTVEAFQQLSFAAEQSGVSQDEMGMSMTRLSRQLYEARMGSVEAQKAFAQAGITPAQIVNMKTGKDALLALADRFKAIDDPIKKQALGMELMGRGSVRMVGFLSKGSEAIRGMGGEAEKLGVVLSGKQVESLVNAEHALLKFWAVLKAVGATFAAYLSPIIQTAIDKFLKFYEANRKILDTNLRLWAEDLAYALGYLHGLVQGIIEVFLDFAKSHQELVRRVVEFGAALIVVSGVMKILSTSLEAIKFLLSPIITLFGVLTTEVAFIEAPLWLVVAVVGAVVASIHDLWKVLSTGSFKDSWLGGMIDGVSGLLVKMGLLKEATNIRDKLDTAGSGQSFLSSVANGAMSLSGSSVPGLGGVGIGGAGGYQMSAPITINVPPGTDPKHVGEKVKEGVKEHLDRVYREADRSLKPAVAR